MKMLSKPLCVSNTHRATGVDTFVRYGDAACRTRVHDTLQIHPHRSRPILVDRESTLVEVQSGADTSGLSQRSFIGRDKMWILSIGTFTVDVTYDVCEANVVTKKCTLNRSLPLSSLF